ncbi:MAG: M48 family metalloprotease [Armatimonadetes bacterium]|nr:M48 family metalloprotease [Armatimonadota bacterium]
MEASRAFLAAIGVSVATIAGTGVAAAAGWRTLQHLAGLLLDTCTRLWGAVPAALQGVLWGVLGTGVLSLIRWALFVGRQWRSTRQVVDRGEVTAVAVPASVRHVAARCGVANWLMVLQDERPLALTAGVLFPRIIISSGLIDALDEDEFEAVLLHERHHVRHGDPLRLAFARGAARAFFYLPVVGELYRRYVAASELAADAYAIRTQGDPAPLAAALLKLLRTHAIAAPAGAQFQGTANLRLAHLLDPDGVALPGLSRKGTVQGLAAAVGLTALSVMMHALPGIIANSPFFVRCIV